MTKGVCSPSGPFREGANIRTFWVYSHKSNTAQKLHLGALFFGGGGVVGQSLGGKCYKEHTVQRFPQC